MISHVKKICYASISVFPFSTIIVTPDFSVTLNAYLLKLNCQKYDNIHNLLM